MRVLTFSLLLAAVAGCHFEPRATAPATPEAAEAPRAPTAEPAPSPSARAEPGERPEVVLYVTEWCPYCRQARDYMAAEEIPHRVVDIEASAEGAAEYQAMGGTGPIPLVAVGSNVIEGWSAEVARQMLDEAGYD